MAQRGPGENHDGRFRAVGVVYRVDGVEHADPTAVHNALNNVVR